ncbi:protein ALP1-like [Xenia sp. Carnegie-2017]|uniref:protein ALP1-like n=1 Tax=Xenia sp. Carnegie-2017 TaxID=2897299 RepID=UPI001F0369F9|nr:protein ALP1-like [Xenia sp. Carnegie-2017]
MAVNKRRLTSFKLLITVNFGKYLRAGKKNESTKEEKKVLGEINATTTQELRFTRMSPERLEHLLSLVAPYMKKRSCRSRETISIKQRLVVTLRYLATEKFDAIWKALRDEYLKLPKSEREWHGVAEEFLQEWGFPHCIGAIDGKHVNIDCPKNAGSLFYNYKNYHSTVIMAICDAKYRFLFVDIGSYGRNNDAAIFSQTEINKKIENGQLGIPGPSMVSEYMLPYVITGDDIFPLKTWLMKPFPGKGLTQEQAIFNYRLSRCRRTIENTFGILAARWRIYRRPIRAAITTVDLIVQATVCLHNYLSLTQNAYYIPKGFVDAEDGSGNIINGEWRHITQGDESTLQAV